MLKSMNMRSVTVVSGCFCGGEAVEREGRERVVVVAVERRRRERRGRWSLVEGGGGMGGRVAVVVV